MTKQKQNGILIWAQAIIWLCVLCMPYLIILSFAGKEVAGQVAKGSFFALMPLMVVYFVNFLWVIPKFLFGKKKKWFYIINLALVFSYLVYGLIDDAEQLSSGQIPAGFSVSSVVFIYLAVSLFAFLVVILLAVGLRYMMRYNEMQIKLREEEKRKKEAELTWLSYQLNPHFLFNTMNNISSLTQIDPDMAQDSIGRLSDMLRYALYEAKKQVVPLSGEISFMRDYIDLMKLRCNSLTQISTEFKNPSEEVFVAPLLFISLIENAFKHGVNARQDSFISIYLAMEGPDLVFECANSVFEKAGEDHIGSGIGLENLRHRLELLYQGKFLYSSKEENGTYSVKLILKNIKQNG